MIDAATIAGVPSDVTTRRRDTSSQEDAPGFSYALAAATLEKNASQSLQAHGARPSGSAGQPQQENSSPRQGALDANNQQASAAQTKTLDNKAQQSISPERPHAAAAQGAAPSSAGAATPAAVAVLSPITIAPTRLAANLSDAAAVRDLAEAKGKNAPLKAPRLPAEAPALKTAFAEILARRLEKTSVFDIRLDPPDLGRVDGRLAIDDNGKSVLSLSFDNQSAFDLFSRDEQALRLALQHSGLNFFADGDFVFAFKERPESPSPPTTGAASVSADAGAYEPSFFANWSAGALDIRI